MLKPSSTTRSAAAKRGAGCIPNFPGPKVSPRAVRFRPWPPQGTANHPPPAAGGLRLRRPTRRSAFFSSTGRGVFSFWCLYAGPPPRPARWGEEEQGSRRSFRRRRKRSLADFVTTTMGGASPVETAPLAGASLPGRLITAPTPLPEAFPASKEKPLLKGVNHTHHAG